MLPYGKPKTIHFCEASPLFYLLASPRRHVPLPPPLEEPRNVSRSVKSNSSRAVCLFHRTFNVNQCYSLFWFSLKPSTMETAISAGKVIFDILIM